MRASLRVTEPESSQSGTSDGRLWSEVAAALETIAARCAERGYVTDRLVLIGSGTQARDTWRVKLVTTEAHRDAALALKANVVQVPTPERYIESEPGKLSDGVVHAFCLLTCEEENAIGLDHARRALSEVLKTANFSRERDDGSELWRAKGRGAKYGKPRWQFVVRDHRLCRILPEHGAPRGKRVPGSKGRPGS